MPEKSILLKKHHPEHSILRSFIGKDVKQMNTRGAENSLNSWLRKTLIPDPGSAGVGRVDI